MCSLVKLPALFFRGGRMTHWSSDIYTAFKQAGVGQVAYVPDAGHKRLIDACSADDEIDTVVLTTEEEGIAITAGAWLGGAKAVVLMQSSGVGNCINMLSLIKTCSMPLALFVTMRGQWREFNPWQTAMGRTTKKALTTAGVTVETAKQPDRVGAMAVATLARAFDAGEACALLLHQSLMAQKTFGKKD
jgi:sulfopyruvate decarboxylase alpha subunit